MNCLCECQPVISVSLSLQGEVKADLPSFSTADHGCPGCCSLGWEMGRALGSSSQAGVINSLFTTTLWGLKFSQYLSTSIGN